MFGFAAEEDFFVFDDECTVCKKLEGFVFEWVEYVGEVDFLHCDFLLKRVAWGGLVAAHDCVNDVVQEPKIFF